MKAADAGPPESERPATEPLRKLAFLNSVTGSLDFATKQVVGFVINPITVSFLGPTLYGAWKIIGQLNNYLATADINVAQPLKLLVAQERSVVPPEDLRRSFTAALCVTGVFVPVYALAGAAIVWIAPTVAGVEPAYELVVRSAASLLVAAFILRQVAALFESVLRGMNLTYKRVGLRASITLLGGVGTALALYLGYGLPGIAAVHVLVAFLTGASLWWIVARHVDWFGLARPRLADMKKMLTLGGWFAVSKLLILADKSSDIVLAGLLFGPEVAGAYAISKFLMNSIAGGVVQVTAASTPGLGKLYGEGKLDNVIQARSQLVVLIWCVATVPGIVICLWNGAFISIWTDSQYFIGQSETLLIVLVGLLAAVQLVDKALNDICLNVRPKIFVTAIAVATTVGLAFTLAPRFHAAGLLIAILVGKIFSTVGYSLAFSSLSGRWGLLRDVLYSRTAIFCMLVLILSGAMLAPNLPRVDGWLSLLPAMSVTALVGGIVVWFLAITSQDRNWMIATAKSIYRSRRSR